MSEVAALRADEVAAAAQALSGTSGFWFTRRGLMFELCRRGAWSIPGADLDGCERDFAEALAAHERASARLARLVRPEEASPGIDLGGDLGIGAAQLEALDLPEDLFDYAIGRVALIERMDLCLMLIANGFHRGLEIALTVPPDFPTHVWGRIRDQLDGGMRTSFLTIHDYSASSGPWLAGIDEQLGGHEHAEVLPAGLTMPWISRLGIPLRGAGPASPGSGAPARSYALLEELSPLRIMRWVYGRVARGAEDFGFG